MLINFLALIGGLVVLVVSADKFVIGTASIARNMGVSTLLIGLTIVGLGTSAPEILVSAIASFEGNGGLAIGNALGSNIANIGLILGLTAMVSPLVVHSGLLKRELPVLALICLMCFLLAFDGLSIGDSIWMLIVLGVFIVWLIQLARQGRQDELTKELEAEIPKDISMFKAIVYTLLGLFGLLVSSRILVWSAVNIAEAFGVSDMVIGLTIVAVGTSLPELAASITSVLKGEDDLAVGNIIGSNVYNLLAVYSLPGFVAGIRLDETVLVRDFPVMLGLTAVLFIMGYGYKQVGRISRGEGGLLVLAYMSYQWVVYHAAVTPVTT
ncbi:calcium/sodium antiporter [methane-oxidizing endosymbiont of Gigantopelta aegis]|uniref:calcium/sodium antiporter n=1 Tax=methane-oxidizing endosymbiont of Gigantopelta aegis TaxID=2794938 RepID=UPI0018DCF918|nr:calcium/sodium antiporter [methane-oxidizing endosymbiont of Gigantopelta aegis]